LVLEVGGLGADVADIELAPPSARVVRRARVEWDGLQWVKSSEFRLKRSSELVSSQTLPMTMDIPATDLSPSTPKTAAPRASPARAKVSFGLTSMRGDGINALPTMRGSNLRAGARG
jgi:hypothetical protein